MRPWNTFDYTVSHHARCCISQAMELSRVSSPTSMDRPRLYTLPVTVDVPLRGLFGNIPRVAEELLRDAMEAADG